MKSLNGVAVIAAWGALAAGGAAHAQDAVQWRIEDGGNGHWYAYSTNVSSWTDAAAIAIAHGGHLATLQSEAEATFIRTLGQSHCWIGLFQNMSSPLFAEPAGGWEWVTGEPIGYNNWRINNNGQSNEPNNLGGFEDWGHLDGERITWNDVTNTAMHYVIEYSADCNGDGLVDYGQILDGTFADTNDNGIPDCCDEGVDCDPCVGDANFDGIVNGADISVLLGFWGLNGKPVAADINKDGQVDGADLAQMLGSWGECP